MTIIKPREGGITSRLIDELEQDLERINIPAWDKQIILILCSSYISRALLRAMEAAQGQILLREQHIDDLKGQLADMESTQRRLLDQLSSLEVENKP